MALALGDRQAIGVRPYSTSEHRVAINMKVLRRNRCGHGSGGCHNEINRLRRRDMFKNDLESRKTLHQSAQSAFDKHGLPVKDIDIMVGHFAVDQQRHTNRLHSLEDWMDQRYIAHPVR